ncbi:MAG: hypothetical protein IJU48_07010 [Synergistaceae bacterium]|nr:hypothetical protein [Synergistaceae bacterium]
MSKYLEYEISSGKIISEIVSDTEPESSEGYSMLEIDENLKLDTTGYIIRDGVLVKDFETNEERLERERLKREQAEQLHQRLKSMIYECVIAILENDNDAIEELRAEYRKMKVYL